MAQFTPKVDSVIRNIQEQTKDIMNEELKSRFKTMANDAIDMSPVWSGAYVKSFSFKSDNTRSRGRRIDGANWRFPVQTGSSVDKEEGRALLLGDIDKVFADNDPLKTKTYTIRNDANHARFVEHGIEGGAHPPGPKPPNGYKIFDILRRRYG